MKFPYVDYGYGLMPVIPVSIGNGDEYVTTEALVDSGASRSIFDAEFAVAVGIDDVEAGEALHFEGVTGHRLVGYVHPVTLIVGGKHFPDVPITFSHHMPDNAVNILGQQDFFDLFSVTFTFRKKELELISGKPSSQRQ